MIYILKAPCLACKGCGKACDKTCTEFTKLCGCILKPLQRILDRPLGGYVLMTLCMMFPTLLFALGSFVDSAVTDCEDAPIVGLCLGNAIFAIIHMAFAIYIQERIVRGLIEKAKAKG